MLIAAKDHEDQVSTFQSKGSLLMNQNSKTSPGVMLGSTWGRVGHDHRRHFAPSYAYLPVSTLVDSQASAIDSGSIALISNALVFFIACCFPVNHSFRVACSPYLRRQLWHSPCGSGGCGSWACKRLIGGLDSTSTLSWCFTRLFLHFKSFIIFSSF